MNERPERRDGIRHYDDLVVLGGAGEQAWCVERTGRHEWTTYWSERGNPAADRFRADSASGATHILVGRLVHSRLLAGNGYWSPSDDA